MPYKDPEKARKAKREWTRKQYDVVKAYVFSVLGDKCCQCGYSNPLALQIDHIVPLRRTSNGLGRSHGRNLWTDLYYHRISLEGLQMLCANCHAIKTAKDIYNRTYEA